MGKHRKRKSTTNGGGGATNIKCSPCCQGADSEKRTKRTKRTNRGGKRDKTDEDESSSSDFRSDEQITYQLMMREKAANERVVCVATFDYEAASSGELTLKKGDRVELLEKKVGDTKDFVFVRLLKEEGHVGYVATNYLAPEGTIEAEDYYFGPITRREAVKHLKDPQHPGGSYLIRDSETSYDSGRTYESALTSATSPYVMSVKDMTDQLHHFYVYDRGVAKPLRYLFSGSKTAFAKIQDLIAHYTAHEVPTDICCKLTARIRRPTPRKPPLSKEMMDKWREIPPEQLHMGKTLGSGNFGVVVKAVWKPPGGKPVTVAVKKLKDASSKAKDAMLKEAAAMRHLNHNNIVRLYGVSTRGDMCCMVTEYVKDKSLREFLEQRRLTWCYPALPDSDCIDMAAQICRGMTYLEQERVIHRDLAARNVLINIRDGKTIEDRMVKLDAKICDFGLARVLDASQGLYRMINDTPLAQQWLSPEALVKWEFSSKSDVWAFGCTLCELFSEGQNPFPANMLRKLPKLLKRGTRPPTGRQQMRRCGVEQAVFLPCTKRNPEDRPTFTRVLADLESLFLKRVGYD